MNKDYEAIYVLTNFVIVTSALPLSELNSCGSNGSSLSSGCRQRESFFDELIVDAEDLRIAKSAKKFAPFDEVDLAVFFR